jgi:hypothetical protein
MVPKKVLTLFPDPEAKLYSFGNYTMEVLEKGTPYLDRSQK